MGFKALRHWIGAGDHVCRIYDLPDGWKLTVYVELPLGRLSEEEKVRSGYGEIWRGWNDGDWRSPVFEADTNIAIARKALEWANLQMEMRVCQTAK